MPRTARKQLLTNKKRVFSSYGNAFLQYTDDGPLRRPIYTIDQVTFSAGATAVAMSSSATVIDGGGPRAYQDQFRGFKSHRVHARRGCFLH